ncbi:hypothetical protein EDEG_02428 [Edhazardia aedis USNM 41457]|uniref:Uncharacterized protein n=1 Tax=Edhazardia aedis (strain USNM 41457) TaxID=1003232 RepID=J8ZU70_EDHAE|nr:hypothetical protein EDEG_02428 [Edhazardia aedis USNM 41457]|eukprot:EJW03213.1 hypothetical protein EDEG_02428 [Edhazardia aedis USNM 41457]
MMFKNITNENKNMLIGEYSSPNITVDENISGKIDVALENKDSRFKYTHKETGNEKSILNRSIDYCEVRKENVRKRYEDLQNYKIENVCELNKKDAEIEKKNVRIRYEDYQNDVLANDCKLKKTVIEIEKEKFITKYEDFHIDECKNAFKLNIKVLERERERESDKENIDPLTNQIVAIEKLGKNVKRKPLSDITVNEIGNSTKNFFFDELCDEEKVLRKMFQKFQ